MPYISDAQASIHKVTELAAVLTLPLLVLVSRELDGWLFIFMIIYIICIILIDGGLLIRWWQQNKKMRRPQETTS
jgi:hypothetical protein